MENEEQVFLPKRKHGNEKNRRDDSIYLKY